MHNSKLLYERKKQLTTSVLRKFVNRQYGTAHQFLLSIIYKNLVKRKVELYGTKNGGRKTVINHYLLVDGKRYLIFEQETFPYRPGKMDYISLYCADELPF